MSRKQKILIVDDEPINIDVLSGLLKPHYALLVAKSGEKALKAVQTGKPDLILLDIMMPEMDGYEVCRRLKADDTTRHIPVIFITAINEVENEAKGLQIGAADYITKPISPSIVMARVNTQLELVKHEQELQAAYSLIKTQKDRMTEELDIGREIQMSMMPVDFPQISNDSPFDLHAILLPARELGGDFYDFFFLDETTICLCVGDVSGKGVSAALYMAVTKTLIRSAVKNSQSTAEIITEVNNTLAADDTNYMFVTLFLAICKTDCGEITYTNAGHNPPYIIQANGGMLRLDKRHGPVGGAIHGVSYRSDTVSLNRGDTLFLFTDGVTESENSEDDLYGEERLVNFLSQHVNESVESLNGTLMSDLQHFMDGTEQADDITMMSFRYHGPGDSSSVPITAVKTWKGIDSTIAVNEWFDAFAVANHLDKSVQHRINMVIDELIMNIISYAFKDVVDPEVEVRLQLDTGIFVISFIDNGRPFNPFEEATPDTSLPVTERGVGGLGIHLSRELMDDVSYQRVDNSNIVKLEVNISDERSD